MAQATLEEVQALAEQLSPADKARLMTHLSTQLSVILADPSQPTLSSTQIRTGWERLLTLSATMRAEHPHAPSVAEQLEADRQAREAAVSI